MASLLGGPRRESRSGVTPVEDATVRVRIYQPLVVAGMGLLAALIGAWAAMVGFVGPEFGYGPTNGTSWAWTAQNWLLHLVPGVVAVVAGLVVTALARAATFGTRSLIRLAALAIVTAGIWLVIGPALWPLLESGSPYAATSSPGTAFAFQVGSNLGPGLLLVALGATILQAVSASRAAAVVVNATPVAAGPTAMAPPAAVSDPGTSDAEDRTAGLGAAGGSASSDEDRGAAVEPSPQSSVTAG